ncbi:hypothetical protein IB286_05565 [Spongiibacter sp. KMU-158]|uniref:Tetratricopeptide repeat protein n=1 Tax=Spongiibacter pelagi TaxID=2760804 RepID=A0A927C1J6_9GAMM|nr:hypothetical protein [Spongiibacter pelagi]MBD2858473.1 hypothetical protein [Spongiibacter pelagi]
MMRNTLDTHKNVIQKLGLLCFSLGLFACASSRAQDDSIAMQNNCGIPLAKADNIKLDLIENQVNQKQYYAALAYLEKAINYPRVLKLRGDAQRHTGQLDAAFDSYRELSMTCLVADGHAGMAKILATRGDINQARLHMLKARQQAPANADIRNDFGFILLAYGDFRGAQREFLTTLELAPGHSVAIRNMVVSLILDQDVGTAKRMAKTHHIEAEEWYSLLDQAKNFKKPALANRQKSTQEPTL